MDKLLRTIDVSSRERAEALYGSLCNVVWRNSETDEEFSVTWRAAGDLVAKLRGRWTGKILAEDYLDYYCSGSEGCIDPDIAIYLGSRGWVPYTRNGSSR